MAHVTIVVFVLASATAVYGWTPLGIGVAYEDYGFGKNVLICYGGYGVTDTWARAWADRLVTHSDLRSLAVGKVYAVKGPRDVLYNAKEISNSKLVQHLLAHQSPGFVAVAAHSSGAFVANEFFSQLVANDINRKFNQKIIYYNLDGDGGPYGNALSMLRKEYFVYARMGSMFSMNANSMKSHGRSDQLIELDGSGSHCQNSRCLHDVMIIHHPWNPTNFDVSRDYSLYALGDREVQLGYISDTVSLLSGMRD
ncbi:uncharacterized protein LOC124130958 isoform X1 [Haliotis rufescens]|uniref:uncharacterized protein LOC124130958 isoform X1 n=1 Tax=Haliotis rufescens TaxID=6454 RepID=UPI001EB02BF2|nr:uncharacterized protein LOC124130958 isoform X1 [Haliotis rufescens]